MLCIIMLEHVFVVYHVLELLTVVMNKNLSLGMFTVTEQTAQPFKVFHHKQITLYDS